MYIYNEILFFKLMEKNGFVYEWTNLKNGMKYIGSHFGFYDDGYISSSKYFNSIYHKTPHTFKRIIIKSFNSRKDALDEEKNILYNVNAAKNINYYNLHNESGNGWSHHDDPNLSKIYYERISKAKKGVPSKMKGTKMKETQKIKLSDEWEVSGPTIDGKLIICNMLKFCKAYNLNPSAMSAVSRGKRFQHKGYKCKKITNKRKVDYFPMEWKSKGKVGGFTFGSKNKSSRKVKIDGIIYDCINDASKSTKLSRYLIKKIGDFNV